MNYTDILDEMLRQHQYLCLATSSLSGEPWATPVSYVRGKKNKLYFISNLDSLHVKNIEENPRVAFSIFDSHQVAGSAFGVQGSGKVHRIIDNNTVPNDVQGILFERISLAVLKKIHAFYVIEIAEIYLPDAERWKSESNIRIPVAI